MTTRCASPSISGRFSTSRCQPDDLRVIFGVAGAVEILAWWLKQPGDLPLDQIATILDRLVIAPTWKAE